MRFSASRISTWMTCPLQAYYKYTLSLPTTKNAKTVFGSIVHHSLDIFNRTGDVEEAVGDFFLYWEEPERLGERIDWWPRYSSYPSLREKGEQIIRDFADKNKWETRRIHASEHKFLVPFGEHELSGIVDYVESKGVGQRKTLRIVDLKTASRTPRKDALKLNVQFTVYIYASTQPEFWLGEETGWGTPIDEGDRLYEEMQDVKRRGVWYHLMSGKEYTAGGTEDVDFMRLYRVVQEIAKAEELGVYVPKISEDSCTWCDFTEECGIEIPVTDEAEEAYLL